MTVATVIYTMTKFHYAKCDPGFSAYEGVMLQWFEFTKVCMGENRHFSRNFDTLTILNALLSFPLSSCFSAQSEAF